MILDLITRRLFLDRICHRNNDKAGQKCTLSAIKKFRNKTDLKVMELPEGKDPGDCTKDELLSAYLNRRRT